MDVQRAPQPEKSDLEVFMRVRGPELLQKHAANILMIVLLIAALAMYLYTRSRNKQAEQAATNQNTAIAYSLVQQARELFLAPVFTDAIARERQAKVRDVLTAVELVTTSDADASQKAAALLSKAEIFWLLANAPAEATSTTQPAVGFTQRSSEENLKSAEEAYTEILRSYADQKEYVANALLSLAAIAETRRDFAKAKQSYEQAMNDASLRPVYHEMAKTRLAMLDDISIPYTLAAPTSQPTSQPSSMPATAP